MGFKECRDHIRKVYWPCRYVTRVLAGGSLSMSVGIVGLHRDIANAVALLHFTAQLQKLDDASPHHLEYDHIRDHIEPYLKSGLAAAQPMSSNTLGRLPSHLHPSSKRPTPTSAIAAAARALTSSSSTVLRDIPSSISSASRFNSLHNLAMKASSNPSSASKYGGGGNLPSTEDTFKAYQSLSIKGKGREMLKPDVYEKERLQKSRELDAMEDIPRRSARAPSQLWSIPWQPPLLEEELRPLRIPLKSKKTKRCHACRHIVVKVSRVCPAVVAPPPSITH